MSAEQLPADSRGKMVVFGAKQISVVHILWTTDTNKSKRPQITQINADFCRSSVKICEICG